MGLPAPVYRAVLALVCGLLVVLPASARRDHRPHARSADATVELQVTVEYADGGPAGRVQIDVASKSGPFEDHWLTDAQGRASGTVPTGETVRLTVVVPRGLQSVPPWQEVTAPDIGKLVPFVLSPVDQTPTVPLQVVVRDCPDGLIRPDHPCRPARGIVVAVENNETGDPLPTSPLQTDAQGKATIEVEKGVEAQFTVTSREVRGNLRLDKNPRLRVAETGVGPVEFTYLPPRTHPSVHRKPKNRNHHERKPKATNDPHPTRTARATRTPAPTPSPRPTSTPAPTKTPPPTRTPHPTKTPQPTKTPRPTSTPHPTKTPRPTRTAQASRAVRSTTTPTPAASRNPTTRAVHSQHRTTLPSSSGTEPTTPGVTAATRGPSLEPV